MAVTHIDISREEKTREDVESAVQQAWKRWKHWIHLQFLVFRAWIVMTINCWPPCWWWSLTTVDGWRSYGTRGWHPQAEFDLLNWSTLRLILFQVEGIEPSKCGLRIRAFAQLGVSRGLDNKETVSRKSFTVQMPVLLAAHSLEQAPGLQLSRYLVPSLCTCAIGWLWARVDHSFVVPTILFMRDSLDSIIGYWFWMKWDDSMIGQKKKSSHRGSEEAALAQNDL